MGVPPVLLCVVLLYHWYVRVPCAPTAVTLKVAFSPESIVSLVGSAVIAGVVPSALTATAVGPQVIVTGVSPLSVFLTST